MMRPTPLYPMGLNVTATVRSAIEIEPMLISLVNIVLFTSGVPSSLPISIALIPRNHAENGALDQRNGMPEPALTSANYRKASYAARDRSRSLDPGTLDFEAGGDDESIEGDDGDADSLSRGRRRALKILQARSELPDEGMWRSLAS
jgi:hypothetical protein